MFGSFKTHLNQIVNSLDNQSNKPFELFHVCALISKAFTEAFITRNIEADIKISGIWPPNADKLLSLPRPRAPHIRAEIMDSYLLAARFENTRNEFCQCVLAESAILRLRGYVDTTYGELMTSDNVMALVTAARNKHNANSDAAKVAAKTRALSHAKAHHRQQKHLTFVAELVAVRGAALCILPLDKYKRKLRRMDVGRAIARYHTAKRKQ